MSHKINWRLAKQQWQYSGKLSETNILEIFKLSKNHTQYKIADYIGVSKGIVSSLLTGKTYKHLQQFNSYIPRTRKQSL